MPVKYERSAIQMSRDDRRIMLNILHDELTQVCQDWLKHKDAQIIDIQLYHNMYERVSTAWEDCLQNKWLTPLPKIEYNPKNPNKPIIRKQPIPLGLKKLKKTISSAERKLIIHILAKFIQQNPENTEAKRIFETVKNEWD